MKSRFELMEEQLRKLREAGEKTVGEALPSLPHEPKREKKTRYARK